MKAPDISTAISPVETTELSLLSQGRRVVEAGALLGYSTVVIARQAAFVASIDKHVGYGSAPTFRPFLRNLARYHVNDKVQIVVDDALLAITYFPYDISFVDLTGEYEITRQILTVIRTPITLVHDFARPNCDGVQAAIQQSPDWRLVRVVDTLAILERKEVR